MSLGKTPGHVPQTVSAHVLLQPGNPQPNSRGVYVAALRVRAQVDAELITHQIVRAVMLGNNES